MKNSRFIAPLFILALFVSIAGAASIAHAQTATDNCLNDGKYACADGQTCLGSPIPTCQTPTSCLDTGCPGDETCVGSPPVCQNIATPNACDPACTGGLSCINGVCASPTTVGEQAAGDVNGPTATVPSSVTNPASPAAAATPKVISDSNPLDIIMAYIMELFAWLLGVAAITLDYAMYYTVVHMGSYVNGLSAVGVAWRILRDLGNIVLLFGFIILGIETILDLNFYGGGTKLLPKLLIAAVFLNFSLFVAEAVIDTGNLFATEFYTQINGGQAAGSTTLNDNISNTVMSQLGLQTIYGSALNLNNNGSLSKANVFQSGNVFLVGFMSSLLFMIAAFVFFSLAFILIARFIFLIFLIILAPIGFAGFAIPRLDKLAGQWWEQLVAQTITAPAMLLMLYVALAVITDSQFLTGLTTANPSGTTQSWVDWIAGGQGVAGLASILLSFIVAMGLLMAVVMLSKRLGAFGGAWATKTAGAVSFGAVGFVGRRTAGRGLNAAAARFQQSSWSRAPFVGRSISRALEAGAKSSYDIRGTRAGKSVAAGTGVDLGEASKGGYSAIVEAGAKERIAYSKTLQLTKKEQDEKKALDDRLAVAQRARDAELERLGAPTEDNKEARKRAQDLFDENEKEIKRTTFKPDGSVDIKGLDYYNNLAQREYATKLKKPLPFGMQYIYEATAGPRIDTNAAKKILAEANKGQAAKLKDALDDFGKTTAAGGH